MGTTRDQFATEVAGLPDARPTEVVELSEGDRYELRIAPVAKQVAGATVRMLAYNGSIPGPVLKVREGSQILVEVENQGDMDSTVHWHGLRLDNRYDGTHLTQSPIRVGGRFSAVIKFPDPGAYWYHPHIRSDYGIEMGLYGGVVVDPAAPDYWPPVHRELFLTLDDLLLEEGKVAAFDREKTTHAAMGRFGNVLLVNGETDLSFAALLGEVLRLYLVNTANTRVFNVGLPGARMKLVGGDSGRVEQEAWVDEVVLAPSERAVVDVRFEQPGDLTLRHRTPDRVYPLASITVHPEQVEAPLDESFGKLRANPDLAAERARIQPYLQAPPGKTLSFLAEMDFPSPEGDQPEVYVCPMHPEVVAKEPGHCPKCAMKLLPRELVDEAGAHEQAQPEQAQPEQAQHVHGGEAQGALAGIEWEDDMVEVNRLTTPANMHWQLVDQDTDAVNTDISWRFRVGDQVKIRLVNEMSGDHPMHHPFHIHGAGRFLVLSRDGVVEPNLVWKDTVLLRTGETVDILLDVTEPGSWMAHCHIAEHHETGMMFNFEVAE